MWSGTVKDRFMLGGLCLDISIDGVVVPANSKRAVPAKATTHWLGPERFGCYLWAIPSTQVTVREPDVGDDEKRAIWSLASATAAEAAGAPAKQRAEEAALRV